MFSSETDDWLEVKGSIKLYQQRRRSYLRTLLVHGAQLILGSFGVDCDLRRWGLKLAERGGKSGKKRAIVYADSSWLVLVLF